MILKINDSKLKIIKFTLQKRQRVKTVDIKVVCVMKRHHTMDTDRYLMTRFLSTVLMCHTNHLHIVPKPGF